MSAVGPVDHIARPTLPWRTESDLTECGRPIKELEARVVPRETIEKRVREIGKQRAAFTTCMTCATTCNRYLNQLLTPLAREISAVQYFEARHVPNPQRDRKQRLLNELEAIAALVSAHREEFDGYLKGLRETVSLADRRSNRRVGDR